MRGSAVTDVSRNISVAYCCFGEPKEELNAATALGNTFFVTLFHTHECPSSIQHIRSNRQILGNVLGFGREFNLSRYGLRCWKMQRLHCCEAVKRGI